MEQLNKLQIKAEILTVISKLQINFESSNVDEILKTLSEQTDKKAILDVLAKELIKANEQKAILICFLLIKLCKDEGIDDVLWGSLKNPSISDAVKTIILNVLKDLGNKVDYNKLEEYFENPNDVIDADTQRLLQTAIINPEAQIDFLDFLNSLSEADKKILIQSLGEDYTSDTLANILNPLVLYSAESELGEAAIEILGGTKSQLALHTLNEALEFVEKDLTKAIIKRNISKLKLSGIREDNAITFYRNILPSKPYEAYISYPDGHGNQAVMFARKKDNEKFQLVAIVLSDVIGIIDCFGFDEVSKYEFERIADKFFKGDAHVKVQESFIKNLLLNAEKTTRKTGSKLSYEYICWKTLLSDIENEQETLEQLLKNKISPINLSDNDLEKIYMFDFIQRWFFDTEFDSEFKELITELNNKIKNNSDIDFEEIVNKKVNDIYNQEQKSLFDKRLLMSAYLKELSDKHEEAKLIYSLYLDEDKKSKLEKNTIRKSIYEYYVSLKFKSSEEQKTTNIFTMKNKPQILDLSEKQIESTISSIEKIWVKN